MMGLSRFFQYRLIITLLVMLPIGVRATERFWVRDSRPLAAVHVPEGLMDEDRELTRDTPYQDRRLEEDRRRLRESVRDLLLYVEQMSGAALSLHEGAPEAPPADGHLPVLISDLARDKFGPPAASDLYGQGWRLVVSDQGVGLLGETDLATSYAIYEVLHRWGCRWFMPGEIGASIPEAKTLSLPDQDVSETPATLYRWIWYADVPFLRRNRQGGLQLRAHHALEGYITREQREENPEWRAVINGQPHPHRIKWSREDVAHAIADNIIERLDRQYEPSISLSPGDGMGWDEEEDPAFDAGDWDEAASVVSKTDRLMLLCNRVAERVGEKYPDVLFGVIAYVDYTRPPVREPVHPNVIPQIAPITYNRAHPMTWENHPNDKQLLELVEGWAAVSDRVSHYWYAYNLSETWSPNPFITKWSVDVPICLENNGVFWMPETMETFENTLIGLYLGMRLSWDADQDPAAIVAELMERFYGAAAEPMNAYWHHIDRAWVDIDEFAGCARGHLRRFPPPVMQTARDLMDAALAACETDTERARVAIADESLKLFERFMGMKTDLAEGRLAGLEADFEGWVERARELGEQYRPNYAFGDRQGRGARIPWMERMYGRTYSDASRIAREQTPLLAEPIRQWRYRVDADDQAEAAGWLAPDHDDADWKTTDSAIETWSSLGLHNYQGAMAYRTTVKVPEVPEGKRVTLWLAATDGSAKLFVNGQHVPWITDAGEEREAFRGYALPASFDITDALLPGEENRIAFLCRRRGLNELGTGGLLGPVLLFHER